MNHFYISNPEAERLLGDCLREAKEALCQTLGTSLSSLILFGSLCRGEGVWRESDGRVQIVSDVDLLAIVNRSRPLPAQLAEQTEDISQRHGVHVDVEVATTWQIRNLWQPTLRVDLLNSQEALVGRRFESRGDDSLQFDMNDVIALAQHRAAKCVLAINDMSSATECNDQQLLAVEAAKTAVVCADLVTIRDGRYRPSLVERQAYVVEAHPDLPTDFEPIRRDIVGQIDAKLRDELDIASGKDHWLHLTHHLYTLLDACHQRDHAHIAWEDYITDHRQWRRWWLKPLTAWNNRRKLRQACWALGWLSQRSFGDPRESIRVAALALHRARSEDLNERWLRFAEYSLATCVAPETLAPSPELEWNRLRDQLARLHERGIGPY